MKRKIEITIRRILLRFQETTLSSLLFVALALMLFGSVELKAADNGNVNVAANIVAGTLDLTVPGNLNFNNGSPGQTIIANTATDEVVVNDTRGSKAGWNVTGYFITNFYKTTDANVQMPLNQSGTLRMYWGANNGGGGSTINNITGTAGEAIGGANNNFPGIDSANSLSLMTDSSSGDNGAGAFNMVNLKFNYGVPATASAANYTTLLKLTVAQARPRKLLTYL